MKIGRAVSEKKTFKDYQILYKYIAQGQGQIAQEVNILTVTKRVCYFDHTLVVFNTFLENDFTILSLYKSIGIQII